MSLCAIAGIGFSFKYSPYRLQLRDFSDSLTQSTCIL